MGGVESWRCLCVIRSATCEDGQYRAVFSLHLLFVYLSYLFFLAFRFSWHFFFFCCYCSVLCALRHQCKTCIISFFFNGLWCIPREESCPVGVLIFCVFFFHQLTITTTGKENERVCEWVGESEGHRSCSHVVLVGSVFIPRQTKMRWRITGAFGFCINLNNAKSEKECFSFCFYQPVRWRSCCQLSLSLCLLFSWFFFSFYPFYVLTSVRALYCILFSDNIYMYVYMRFVS